jgi:FixJ family two-component response regulator
MSIADHNKSKDKISILVLDDEQEIVNTVIEILDNEDYRIEGCIQPKTAMEKIEKGNYDIILTDLVMPDSTGIDVANFVHEKKIDALVIVITAYATVESAVQAVQLGVHNYIRKPFNHNDLQLMVRRAVDVLKLKRKNILLSKKNQRVIKNISLLCEISSVLYQVHDTAAASNMILDTLEENFNVKRCAVAIREDSTNSFRIINSRNLPQVFVEEFNFTVNKQVNETVVSGSDFTHIIDIQSEIETENKKFPAQDINHIIFLPVAFQNVVAGFLIIFMTVDDPPLSVEDLNLLKILSIQISPVLYGLKCGFKTSLEIEEQLEKIVADHLFESQSMLQPISFALFRIRILEPFDNHVQLSDLIERYKKQFKNVLRDIGQLYWISIDTLLVILPGVDYFHAESKCAQVKESIESISMSFEYQNAFQLAYSCLGYPQSGEDLTNIVRDLWSKLLYEHSLFDHNEHYGAD